MEEIKTENLAEASAGLIPKEHLDEAVSVLAMAWSQFNVAASNSSKKDVIRAIKYSMIDGKKPILNSGVIKYMSEKLIDMVEATVIIRGYELQNQTEQPIGEGEENVNQ